MFKYILIVIISYLLGIFTLILFSIMKISSKCSREEERREKQFIDYGKIAYEELEKREKENNDVLNKKEN